MGNEGGGAFSNRPLSSPTKLSHWTESVQEATERRRRDIVPRREREKVKTEAIKVPDELTN